MRHIADCMLQTSLFNFYSSQGMRAVQLHHACTRMQNQEWVLVHGWVG